MLITIVVAVLTVGGVFFLMASSIGLIRFPDFYTRSHAIGKADTLGLVLLIAGLAIYNGWELSTLKLVLIIVFILITNPTATHIIVRAAIRSGLSLWTRKAANGDEGHHRA